MHEAVEEVRRGRRTLVAGMLVAVAATLVTLCHAVWRFPESAAGAGRGQFAGVLVVLLMYGAFACWGQWSQSHRARSALGEGAWVGLLLGVLAAMDHWLEVFANLRSPLPAIVGVGMWAVLFLGFGAAGVGAYRRLRFIRCAALAGLWSGMLFAITIVLFASLLALLSMPHMQVFLAQEFAASGMLGSAAYVVRDLFGNALSHLLVGPAVGAIVGVTSAVISSLVQAVRRPALLGLAAGDLLLLAAAICSISFASTIDRSGRPPYVMFGLLALGLSLASAYPLAQALRRAGPEI